MNPYQRYLLPRLVNCVCGSSAICHQRGLVVPAARGRVLEIGFGSGLNLPFYDPSRVEWIWALEPSLQMRALAAPSVASSGLDVRMLDLPGEALPLPDRSVDTVVVTFTLCTIPDVEAALAQMRRVLRRDGRLLFCEHGASPDADVRRWQDRLNGIWRPLAGGCNLNREIAPLIRAAGFQIDELHNAYLHATPRFAGYITWGSARPDGS
ncbi:class I SAM-dependent methyltransferase [Hydrogenophaga sp.]|uniref:class I SAM-dependent methyltransferase n=1 Tax=Hydrogenophaga sp. TaxID=1904254 RepID=UPI0025BA49FA|nr:class I SAM-dependent methyltransferase [Hydrogenophaga sp.]